MEGGITLNVKENQAINQSPDYLRGLSDGYKKGCSKLFEQYGKLLTELDSQIPRQYLVKTETNSEMYKALKACENFLCEMSSVDTGLLAIVQDAMNKAEGKI